MSSNRITRRTALKGLGAAVVVPALPGCANSGASSSSGGPAPELTLHQLAEQKIDTVVFLMMENRSMDHYLGTLSLIENRPGIDGLLSTMSNPHPAGGVVSPHPATQMCARDPAHGWNPSRRQWNEGRNDGFVTEHVNRYGDDIGREAMAYHDRATLQSIYALADQYGVCNRWFSSVMGPTWPNRFYSMAASSQGQISNVAPSGDYTTIFTRLDAHHKTWADYAGNLPFVGLLPRMSLDDPEFRYLEEFYANAAAGTLPNYSVIEPIYGRNDDHPSTHPVAGQILIASVYAALAQSPQWERCLLVITYDEHGGWFDHVSPPTTVDPLAAQGFDRMGFRVPSIIAGPWVKDGYISDTVFDHTSMLATLETLWQMDPINTRDAAANDLFEFLDEDRLRNGTAAAPVTLPVIEADERIIYAENCLAGLPSTAPGTSEPPTYTDQPELEQWMDQHFPGHPKVRHRQSYEVYRQWLTAVSRLGVFKTT